jgi:arylsulfatase A-like enzyme
MIELYKTNLREGLNWVKKIIEKLDGKIVVTSDHGEAFDEILHPFIPIRIWQHFEGVRIPSLIKVPWLEVEKR